MDYEVPKSQQVNGSAKFKEKQSMQNVGRKKTCICVKYIYGKDKPVNKVGDERNVQQYREPFSRDHEQYVEQ